MLKATMGWCTLCAVWMTYIVGVDFWALMHSVDAGGFGIFVDHRLLVMVSAMPFELASTAALMEAGRKAAITIEIAAAVAYYLMAVGLWRGSSASRIFATCFFAVASLLLAFYLGYIIPSHWSSWGARVGAFAVGTALSFLVINASIAIYFLRTMIRRPVPLG